MNSQPDSSRSSETPRESPRAFAIGAGRIIQTIGALLFVGSFVLWAIGHWWIPRFTDSPVELVDYFRGPNFVRMVIGLNLAASVVGGLGLFAAGLGLAGEQRGSGRIACTFTGLLAAFYLVSSVALFWQRAWLGGGFASLLALSMLPFLAMAWESAAVLRRHPPPHDQSAVTDEVLERLRSERDERRKKYDI